MTEAIKNAVALILFCAPIAGALTWVAWWSRESMLLLLLFLGVLSAIWVVGSSFHRSRRLNRTDTLEVFRLRSARTCTLCTQQ